MTHDPMCPCKPCGRQHDTDIFSNNSAWACNDCQGMGECQCDLITKIREDERRQAVERVRAKKGKFPSTRLDWDTIVIAILDGTKLRLSKKELNEQA